MTAERHGQWRYYRCGRNAYRGSACPRSLCNVTTAHATLERILGSVRLTRELADAVWMAAERCIQQRIASEGERRSALQSDRRQISTEQMRLTDAYATGTLPRTVYEHQMQEVRGYASGASVSESPKKTKIARLSAFNSSGLNVPTRVPSRRRGTAVTLSTIALHGARSPVLALHGTVSRKIGADVGSVVKGHTTTESFASKRSS